MALSDRIKEARKAKGFTQEELGELIGVAKTTVAGYEKNREPTAAKVGEIADALGVDVNFLFQDETSRISASHLTAAELEHLKKYRSLDSHGKKMVNLVLEEEAARMDAEKIVQIAENIIELDNYLTPVSAGTGEFAMYESPKEKIRVIENSYTRKSDYVVKVKGNSMEPRYYDGDMLLVKESGEVGFGDIGIFFVDGDLLVKQQGHHELISLNPEYPPIVYGVLDEQHMCEGKVIGVLDPAWIR